MTKTNSAWPHAKDRQKALPEGRQVAVMDIYILCGLALWCLPGIVALASQSWQTETGSLSPVVMGLGLWTLWQTLRTSRIARSHAPTPLALIAVIILLPFHLFGAVMDMAPLLGLTAWAGLCVAFVASQGWGRTKEAAFALLFIGLTIPLPYSLSLPLTLQLREAIADWATDFALIIGMDVALDRATIIIGGYELAVDTACSGLNSTLSLAAIGLLYAYWSRDHGWRRMAIIAILSIPIALAANILRVIVLMALVSSTGLNVLSSQLHPLAGIVSFIGAMLMLWISDQLLGRIGLILRPWFGSKA